MNHQLEAGRASYELIAALTSWCARQPELITYAGECSVYRAETLQLHGAWRESLAEARRVCERLDGGVERRTTALALYQQGEVHRLLGELPEATAYRNPGQLRAGAVLLVGAGNSGSELAMGLSRSHPVWMSGRDTGQLPFRVEGLVGRLFLVRFVLRFLFHRVLSVGTPIGRKVRLEVLTPGGPLIRVKRSDLDRAGVRRVLRMAGVRGGRPVLEDGQVLDVANVVWCTGFEPGFSWIHLPVLGEHEPLHDRGVVPSRPGLYFVGLHFLSALSSGMIHGVGRDAEHVVRHIAARRRSKGPTGDRKSEAALAR